MHFRCGQIIHFYLFSLYDTLAIVTSSMMISVPLRYLSHGKSKIHLQKAEALLKSRRQYAIYPLSYKSKIDEALRDPAKIRILPAEEIDSFKSYFPVLITDLTQTNLITDMPEVQERLHTVLEYNISSGKQTRPAVLIAAYKFIIGENQLSQEKFREAALLAWCIEMIASYTLMMDDIVDNSETRRGKETWFKLKNVGLNAINDGVVIQMSTFKLLKKYFSKHRHYQDICDVFVHVMLKTFVGQIMDCEKWCFEKSNMQTFNKIAHNKTGYYTFYFPLVSAMLLAERPELELGKFSLEVFMKLGRYYQMQNDFLDVYGESCAGKLGTDIQEGKYSWLIIKAIEKASREQKDILRNCYGKRNSECIEQVKLIYDQLDLKGSFDEEVQNIYDEMMASISTIKNDTARELMFRVAQIYFGHGLHL